VSTKLIKSFFIFFTALSLVIVSTSSYFSDTKVISGNTFSTGYWPYLVINEVYFYVNPETEEEGKNEWLEIYNPNDNAVSLRGFKISANGYERTIRADVEIPAKDFALLSHDNGTWRIWNEPEEILKVNMGASPSECFNNSADTIKLLNKDGNAVDEVSYGPGAVAIGTFDQSIQRKSVGLDTDSVNDWEMNLAPSPGT